MAKKEKRFVPIHTETTFATETKLLVDRKTGVTYLFHYSGQGGGLCVLVDAAGNPVISPIPREDED